MIESIFGEDGPRQPCPLSAKSRLKFAQTVETAFRAEGFDALAHRVANCESSRCVTAALCVALSLSVAHRERATDASLRVLHTEALTVLVENTIGDLIVGLDVLDSGQLRTAIDRFAKPCS